MLEDQVLPTLVSYKQDAFRTKVLVERLKGQLSIFQ